MFSPVLCKREICVDVSINRAIDIPMVQKLAAFFTGCISVFSFVSATKIHPWPPKTDPAASVLGGVSQNLLIAHAQDYSIRY